jgi:cyanophycin synthetase
VAGGSSLLELRVLDGPNLYFTRPAVKLTLDARRWLSLPSERARSVAKRSGMPGSFPPGEPDTGVRRRFVVRAGMQVARRLAEATGTALAVRARPGPETGQIVVAFPWRRRTAAEAFGRAIADLFSVLISSRRSLDRLAAEAAEGLASVEDGPPPTVADPTLPVIAVTGTNGKTTTVRALAHVLRTAGLHVAYTSTDGVYRDGELVEGGDYSGFGGAARALAQPGIDAVVLETARGGILLRGIGTLHNDVAVVTNVSADHLGLHGIHTLDQLAEVKGTITRITRPMGWDVLNADDPRVLAMRRVARGRPWLFSLDPEHPAIRSVLARDGRATTVLDGSLAYLTAGFRTHPLLPVEQIPLTLAGISRHNVQNAMAIASAALAIGLRERVVVRGLRSFVLDPETNPGRANLFELDRRVVVADYAHNEAGMAGLVEIGRGLRGPGSRLWLGFCSAGDRTDEILHGVGFLAARGADRVAVAELVPYLRGRDRQDVAARLRAGALDGGAEDVPVLPDEVAALTWMLDQARPGDVVAITALGQRAEIFALLADRRARRIGPARVRQLVRRARA